MFFSLLMCCSGWILVALVHILLPAFTFLGEKAVAVCCFPLYPSLLYQCGLLENYRFSAMVVYACVYLENMISLCYGMIYM